MSPTAAALVGLLGLVALGAQGCRREAPPASPQVVPQPSKAGAEEAPRKLAGRTFRVPAGKIGPGDVQGVLRAAKEGRPLPGAAEEIGADGKPIEAPPGGASEAVGPPSPAGDPRPAPRGIDPEVVQRVKQQIAEMYTLIAGKPVDIIEVQEVSGMLRVTFALRGEKGPNSTVHVSGDGKLLFEGGSELKRRFERIELDHNFARCLQLKGLRIVGDVREKASQAQLKEVGSFAGLVLVDCAKAPKNCKKLGLKKLPAILHGDDSFTGPRPRAFLETLTGCK